MFRMIQIDQLSTQLRLRLKVPLPGKSAHAMAHIKPFSKVTYPYTIENATPAAVLILLFPQKDDICFFLTQRTETVEHHKGQISLPGGMRENGEQLYETAIRETEEEIGVPKNDIHLMGNLTPFFTPVTGFMIHPFIGWTNPKPKTIIHEKEVDMLFTASIQDLIHDNTLKTETWTIREYDATVPFYNFDGHKVWGATAAILSEFKLILQELKF